MSMTEPFSQSSSLKPGKRVNVDDREDLGEIQRVSAARRRPTRNNPKRKRCRLRGGDL